MLHLVAMSDLSYARPSRGAAHDAGPLMPDQHDPTAGPPPRVDPSDLPIAAAVALRDGLVTVACNAAFADLLGTSPDRLVGASVAELLPPGSGHLLVASADHVDEEPQHLDVVLQPADDEVRGRVTISALGDHVLVLVEDRTDERQELSRVRARVRAADVSTRRSGEDLSAELTLLASFSRRLADAGESAGHERREDLHEWVVEFANRAKDSWQDADRPTDAAPSDRGSPADALAWVEQSLARRIEETSALLVADVGADVQVAASVLRQVLRNLVADALDRSADGSLRHVHVVMVPAADGLEVVVTDTTPGGDARLTSALRSGTATTADDLASSRALAEQAGGWLTTVPYAGGTRRVLWLPTRT